MRLSSAQLPARLLSSLVDWLERVERFLAAHAVGILAVLLCLYACISVLRAISLRFWFDELFTVYVGQQGSLTDLLHAVRDAFDPLPLGFHLLVRPFVRATAWPHVMARVPSIAGFGAMLVGLWVVARRRMGPSNALIAFAFPCLTTAAVVYSVEARPYGLVLGFAALALVCWQAACERHPRTLWLIGLWASLTVALSCHYYAVLLLVPICAGELVRWIQRRRPDIPVFLATVGSLCVLLFSWPVIQSARRLSAHFWSPPVWKHVGQFYTGLVHIRTIVVVILGAALIFGAWILRGRVKIWREASAEASGFLPHEWTAIATLVLLPFLGMTLAVIVTHAYTERYALPALLGIALAIAGLAARCTRRLPGGAVLPAAVLIAGGFVAPLFTAGARARQSGGPPPRFGEQSEVEAVAHTSALPIVYVDGLGYLELHYYLAPEVARRMYFIDDPDLAWRYTGSDSTDRGLIGLAKRVPLTVVSMEPFLAAHREFLLVPTRGSWPEQELRKRAWNLTPLPGHPGDFLARAPVMQVP